MSLDVQSVSSHLSAIVSLFSHVGSRFPAKLCIEMVHAAEKAFAEGKFIQVKRSCEILALAASKQRSYESRLLHEISSRNVGRSIMKILSSPVPSNNSNNNGETTNTSTPFNPTEFIVSLEGLLDVLGANVTIRPNQHQQMLMEQGSTTATSNNNTASLNKKSPRHRPRQPQQTSSNNTNTNTTTTQHVE